MRPYDPVKHKEQWERTLAKNPTCSKCKSRPHARGAVWCRECLKEYQKEKRKKDAGGWYKRLTPEQREKRRRRAAVWSMISRGKIIPKPCEVCGRLETEADHCEGYDRENTYNIRWLCREHHIALECWRKKKLTEGRAVA